MIQYLLTWLDDDTGKVCMDVVWAANPKEALRLVGPHPVSGVVSIFALSVSRHYVDGDEKAGLDYRYIGGYKQAMEWVAL